MTIITPTAITGITSISSSGTTLSFQNVSGGNINVSGVNISSGTNINITGVSTFATGPVLIGTGTSTGTTSQPLQVTGGAYVSGSLGIGTTNPTVSLDLGSKTDAIELPQGTTAQRPSGSAPYIRYNTTNSALEFYNGTDWVEIISDYFPTGSVILG